MVRRLLLTLLLAALPLLAGLEFGYRENASCGSSADIDNLNGLTLSFTVTFLAGDAQQEYVILKSNKSSVGWTVAHHPTTTILYFGVYSTEGGSRRYWTESALDTLYHVTMTWTGNFGTADDEIDIWVNGSEVDNGGTDKGGARTDDSAWNLEMADPSPSSLDWNGTLQCVALWEGVLSDNSIKSLAAGGCRTALKVKEGPPLRYFEMMDGREGATVTGVDSIRELVKGEHCSTDDNLTFRAMEVGR